MNVFNPAQQRVRGYGLRRYCVVSRLILVAAESVYPCGLAISLKPDFSGRRFSIRIALEAVAVFRLAECGASL